MHRSSDPHALPDDVRRLLDTEDPEEAMRLHDTWTQATDDDPIGFPDSEEVKRVWQALQAHASQQAEPSTSPPLRLVDRSRVARPAVRPPVRQMPRYGWIALAATLLIGAIGLGLWQIPVAQRAALGTTEQVVLSDGTTIELNSGATIRYARWFGNERRVYLEGEAFFDVASDGRPFHLETFNATISVLGTRFNVRAWHDGLDQQTTVTLEEGRVRLSAHVDTTMNVDLRPGETRYVRTDATTLISPRDTTAIQHTLAWRAGDFVYQDVWLDTILSDIERRYALAIKIDPTLRRQRLTFALRDPQDATAVLNDLCNALDLRYRPIMNGYEILTP